MIQLDIQLDRDVFTELRRTYRRAPEATSKFVRGTLKPKVENGARRKLVQNPRQSALPFIWSTNPVKQARARAWYFANRVPKGQRGRKRRYIRTGRLVAGWIVLFDARSGTLILKNDAPGVEYVQGYKQVPSHRVTGWNVADNVAIELIERAQNDVIDFWFRYNS